MIRNTHRRVLPVPADRVGALLEQVAEPGNPLWPSENWPPLVLGRPLGVGADGGHGSIRYSCTAYQPGKLVEFTFPPGPLEGTHTFEILERGSNECELRHSAAATTSGISGFLAWYCAIQWMHNALLEDLLDNAAIAVGHPPARPARWSPWVRLLRAAFGRGLSRAPANA
ncbi:hypothetical protein GCM10023318_03690 [Nocardia callitridis]|uniref:SRPBCC family protein n=1 Tax=Nocardia callitridis TaxID=648753 RepID=A0ABP9JUM5_9NOCA